MKKEVLVLVSVLIILVSGVAIFRRSRPSRSALKTGLLSAQGELLAEHTAGLLGQRGGVVILRIASTDQSARAMWDAQIEGFKSALRRYPEMRVITVVDLPPQSMVSKTTGLEFDGATYESLLRKYASAAAIVSFAGPPHLNVTEVERLPQPRPKFVLAVAEPENLNQLLDLGLVDLGFTARLTRPKGEVNLAMTPREQIERSIQFVTRPAGAVAR
jgi:hypothetical protein